MANTGPENKEVYPHGKADSKKYDIQQLLQRYSGYADVTSIRNVASQIYVFPITEEKRVNYELLLKAVQGLLTELKNAEDDIETLSQKQMSLCKELAQKVPNIRELPVFAKFTRNQQLVMERYLECNIKEKKRRELIATYGSDPQALKDLLAKYNAQQLAQILEIQVDVAVNLKNNIPTTSNNPREPAQALEKPAATVDPDTQEPSEIIEDIRGKLEDISNSMIEKSRQLVCMEWLQNVRLLIGALRFRLEILDKESEEIRINEDEERCRKRRQTVAPESQTHGERQYNLRPRKNSGSKIFVRSVQRQRERN